MGTLAVPALLLQSETLGAGQRPINGNSSNEPNSSDNHPAGSDLDPTDRARVWGCTGWF